MQYSGDYHDRGRETYRSGDAKKATQKLLMLLECTKLKY